MRISNKNKWPSPSVQTLAFAKERLEARKKLKELQVKNVIMKSVNLAVGDARRVFDSMSRNDLAI